MKTNPPQEKTDTKACSACGRDLDPTCHGFFCRSCDAYFRALSSATIPKLTETEPT